MSLDIDMQSYAGAIREPAAGVQDETNFYNQEVQDSPVYQEPFEEPIEAPESPREPVSNPQAENFRALREEVDRIKAEREADRRDHQVQLEMLRANSQQIQPKPEPKAERMFEGMDDTDVPSVREIRQEWDKREATYQQSLTNYQLRLEELQVQQMHPDYAEVIEKFALPLVKQKPHLAEGLQGASNKALFAYELGKMAQQMQAQAVAPQRNENAERMVANSKKPGTLSQAGGQAALSKADYYASMSDQEFMRMASRHLDSI